MPKEIPGGILQETYGTILNGTSREVCGSFGDIAEDISARIPEKSTELVEIPRDFLDE